MSDERKVCSWSSRPFTSVRKRNIKVDHRILLQQEPGVGVDVIHEVCCPDRDVDEWTPVEIYECRPHGIDRIATDDSRWWT